MSRAFTLAGVAIALVALAGTADQASAHVLSATMTIAGKKVAALAAPTGRILLETGMEMAVPKAIEAVFGVKQNGEPTHAASPSSSTLKAVESLKGIEPPDLN
jgi:hypothetical protein